MDGQNVDNKRRREAAAREHQYKFGPQKIELIPVQGGLKKNLLDDAIGRIDEISRFRNFTYEVPNRYSFGRIPVSSTSTVIRNPKTRIFKMNLIKVFAVLGHFSAAFSIFYMVRNFGQKVHLPVPTHIICGISYA